MAYEKVNRYSIMRFTTGGQQSEAQMAPRPNDPIEPMYGRDSIFRKKLNELRTTGHISKLPENDSRARSRELERNAMLENVALSMAKADPKEMERVTLLDTLTQLYNQTTITRILADEVRRSKRYRMPMSVLMISVDNFKKIYEAYGALASDSILKGTANLLMNIIRDVDIPGRYQVENFLVLCPNTDASGITVLAERIRARISTEQVSDIGANWTVSVSIGTAAYPANGTSDEDLLKAAYSAMTYSSLNGGNSCTVAE